MAAQVTGDTPHVVALRLMELIVSIEFSGAGNNPPSRNWYLRTYAQCLGTAMNPHVVEEYITEYQKHAAK